MNAHEQVNELLADFALGELSKEQSAKVETHLAECQQCRSELKKLEAVLECAASMKESSADEQACKSAKETLLATVADEENRRQTPRPTIRLEVIWRIIMKSRITKLAAAAVIIIVALFGVSQFFEGTVTFADVIQPIFDAQTAILDIIIGEEEEGEPVIHDMIMGSRIRRTLSSIEGVVSIIDLEAGRILTLAVSKKEAVYIDLKGLPSTPNYMNGLRNVISRLQQSPHFVVEELGKQDVQGQKVIGFRTKSPGTELTIWADPETALPVRIEHQEGQLFTIIKNIQFDVPMDEALFSMEVPEGYTLQEAELDLYSATEEDFIEGLRILAEVFEDGYFPDSVAVEDYIRQASARMKKCEELELSDEQLTELGMKLQQHLLFIRFFKGQGKWYYAGKGVKLGDANKAIFWYQPKDSETYRVIYGDLHVEDLKPEDLPK
jgi:hypothetical protein